ncbi:MAG: ribosome recycling factor [Bacteroidota bacterium]|jgi:ribosome recycling factor
MEEIQLYLDDAKETMEKTLSHFATDLTKVRAGKAMPNMLDGVVVEYYGVPTPISNCSAITTPDARTLAIKPFERNIIKDIERAIINSNVGLNPQNDGEMIRLVVPPLTEDRRKDLAKQIKGLGENAKISVRNIRKSTNEDLRKLIKDGASEDSIKEAEAKVQKITDAYIVKVDELVIAKEKEIMTV